MCIQIFIHMIMIHYSGFICGTAGFSGQSRLFKRLSMSDIQQASTTRPTPNGGNDWESWKLKRCNSHHQRLGWHTIGANHWAVSGRAVWADLGDICGLIVTECRAANGRSFEFMSVYVMNTLTLKSLGSAWFYYYLKKKNDQKWQ